MDQVIKVIESARRQGVKLTADMYTYPAGGTGLDASMPPWVSMGARGGHRRLQDPETRKKIARQCALPPMTGKTFTC
jgi:N-acyl-D-amino-acid deacylase